MITRDAFRNRAREYFKKYYYLLSPLLILLSFPSADFVLLKGFPFFAWISLAPVFMYIRDQNYKQVYFVSFLTGLIGNFFIFEWIGNFGAIVPGGYLFLVMLVIPSMAVFFAFKLFLAEFLSRQFEGWRTIIFPSVWIVIEGIQSIGFMAFPLPFWGYSQYPFTPFIQVASVTGILGVSFLMILFNYMLSELIYFKFKMDMPSGNIFRMVQFKKLAALLALVAGITVWGAVMLRQNDRPVSGGLRVAMIQSFINPWDRDYDTRKWGYLDDLKRLTDAALKKDPDLVIWSESASIEPLSFFHRRGELNNYQMAIFDYMRGSGKPFLLGEIGIQERAEGFYLRRYPQNNALLVNEKAEPVLTYSKIHLVPFGEWFPYVRWLPFIQGIIQAFGGSSFIPGKTPVLFEYRGKKFGALICYEGIFHRLCRKYRQMGADFFVNIVNDGWTRTYRGHAQHFSASVFRAIENGIWYLRAGNSGVTAIVDPYGRVRNEIPIIEKSFLVGDIDFSFNHTTVYSRAGDVVLYMAMIFIALLGILALVARIRTWRTGSNS